MDHNTRHAAGTSDRGHRFDDLVAAERTLVTVRWAAALFTVYLVATYGGPAPAWVEPTGYGLAAVLALANGAAAIVLPRVRTLAGQVRLAATTLAVDAAVVAGFVWLYTFDEGSVHFLLFFVLPAEAALKFRLVGALGMWAAIAVVYAARQAWAAATYGFLFSAPSIVFRMGILLIVSVILGLFALRLSRRSDELSATLQQLRLEEQWRSALIDMLAHDFRLPVSTAMASLDVAEEQLGSLPDEQVRGLIVAARRQNRRGLALADDLLTLARARHDRLELHRDDVAMAPLLHGIVDGFADDTNWVELHVPADLHASVDASRFEQVVTNLLSNARKYGHPPVVVAATGLGADGVELSVSDGGHGVPAEQLADLFTEFGGGHGRDSVGLGLWLVDVVATAHGGQASYGVVDGRPTFTVSLPGDAPAQPVETR